MTNHASTAVLEPRSGFSSEAVAEISDALRPLLADVFSLYLKTKSFHWHILTRPRRPAELAFARVDVVLSCVADNHAVEDVYFGAGNLLGTTGPYTTIVEMSTIAPETAQRLHADGGRLGISVLDVAISGSTPAAESGTLTLFGGGERAGFEAAELIFVPLPHSGFTWGPAVPASR